MESHTTRSNDSYRQILKSTTILGGASGINILLRIIRVKFLALFLGPFGVGLLAIYNSIVEMVGTAAGMGVADSGVRQVAEAVGNREQEKIVRTIQAVRLVVWSLSGIGMALVVLSSSLISQVTFGNDDYSSEIRLLSLSVLGMIIMNGESALLQGMRRINDLAKLTILAGLFGTVLSIPIVLIWGVGGVVLYVVALSFTNLLCTWWYSRNIKVFHVRKSLDGISKEMKLILKLGAALMISGLMTKGTMYLINILVAKQISLEAVGLYQAATVLSTIYVGFVINAMSTDFLPRLTAISKDDIASNRLINEQLEIGILLSVPGVLGTLAFAPLVIKIFYSSAFVAAYEVLQWQILGVLAQVISWPIFCIMIAKGFGKLFAFTVILQNVVHIGFAVAGITFFGLKGAGMASFAMWVFYAIMVYGVAKVLTGFSWSEANARIALVAIPAVGTVFASTLFLDPLWAMVTGGIIATAMAAYSLKAIMGIMGPINIPPFFLASKD